MFTVSSFIQRSVLKYINTRMHSIVPFILGFPVCVGIGHLTSLSHVIFQILPLTLHRVTYKYRSTIRIVTMPQLIIQWYDIPINLLSGQSSTFKNLINWAQWIDYSKYKNQRLDSKYSKEVLVSIKSENAFITCHRNVHLLAHLSKPEIRLSRSLY